MNRCTLSTDLLTKVKNYYKTGEANSVTRRWANKWKPVLKAGKFYKDNKLLVPLEKIDQILQKSAKEGMPLSRDGAFHWLAKKYFGFKKRDVLKWVKRLETVQLLRKMPYVNTRANKVQKKEGAAQILLRSNLEGKGCVGIDLCVIPKQTKLIPKPTWTKFKYLFVAVVQASNYCFAYPMENKSAVSARGCARKLWKDFKEKYGQTITGVIADLGNEFKGEHLTFWRTKNITMRNVSKAWFVERRISILMRYIAALREGFNYKWEYSFKNALEKTNNTYCRKIRKLPEDVTGREIQKGLVKYNRKLKKKPKQKKQPVYYVNQRCRVLTKNARDPNRTLYKSYNVFRHKRLNNWTKTVYTIKRKKKKGYTYVYEINNSWYYPWEIQIVVGKLITLQAPRPKKKPPNKKVSRKK